MNHLRLVVSEQETERRTSQAGNNASHQEIDRVLQALESRGELTTSDVVAAMMVAVMSIAGVPGEASLDNELHAYLLNRLDTLSPSSEMLMEICSVA